MRQRATLLATSILASTASGLLGLTAPSASAAQTRTVTVEGTYQHVVADGRDGRSSVERDLLVAAGKTYSLQLRDGHGLKPGSKVRVKGSTSTSASGPEALMAAETTTTAPAVPTATAASSRRVLVILATWTAPDAVTPESARQQMFGDDDAWFREVSYGAMGLTGDVTPWLNIAGPDAGLCFANHQQTMSQAKEAALAAGFDATAYDTVVLYFPSQSASDCSGYAGWAYQPGGEVWLNGAMNRRTTVHELGHNLGLGHAHAYPCQDASGRYVVLASPGCRNDEYGDLHDAMGGSGLVGHYSVAHKAMLGWGRDRIADLSSGGSATLAPLTAFSGTIGVKVVAGSRTYWLERRTQSGADAGLPLASTRGVLVKVDDPGIAQGPGLLDQLPDGNLGDAVLGFGGTWQTPEGLWLSVGQDSPEGVAVHVGAQPVDTIAPGDVTGVSGRVHRGVLTLSWTLPADGDLAAIKVRLATDGGDPAAAPVVSSGLGGGVSLPAPPRKATWTALITAEDAAGNASAGTLVSISSNKVAIA